MFVAEKVLLLWVISLTAKMDNYDIANIPISASLSLFGSEKIGM